MRNHARTKGRKGVTGYRTPSMFRVAAAQSGMRGRAMKKSRSPKR